jgi:Cft2 family RNA processing exonuclease
LNIIIQGNGQSLTVTLLPAGCMIGRAIWKIFKESEEIVYAVD